MYISARAPYADIQMTYAGVGSGNGIKGLMEKLYDFAGSDIVIGEGDYMNSFNDLQMFPTMAGYAGKRKTRITVWSKVLPRCM